MMCEGGMPLLLVILVVMREAIDRRGSFIANKEDRRLLTSLDCRTTIQLTAHPDIHPTMHPILGLMIYLDRHTRHSMDLGDMKHLSSAEVVKKMVENEEVMDEDVEGV